MRTIALAVVIMCSSFAASYGQVLFSDDFEGNLSQWSSRSGQTHHGVIVTDPLNPLNHVLVFSALNDGGDVYGSEVAVADGEAYLLSFDYLGYALPGSPIGSFGGFIGIADDNSNISASTVKFLGGTCNEGNIVFDLIDDGTWHSYSISFHPYQSITISDGTLRITVEDWNNNAGSCSPGVSGDAFFDNVRLEHVGPVATEPTTWGRVKALYR